MTEKAAVGAWSAVMAILDGNSPTGTSGSAEFDPVEIGVTVLEMVFALYTVLLSGVTARSPGPAPVAMGVPGVFVATGMGMTVLDAVEA
jgi:hypothetical protein